jgi:hypothetical protein
MQNSVNIANSINTVIVYCASCKCLKSASLLTDDFCISEWYCQSCLASIFPFNHFEDEKEFHRALLKDISNTYKPCNVPSNLILQPIDKFVEGRVLLTDPDVDPDNNFFNCTKLCSSNYNAC